MSIWKKITSVFSEEREDRARIVNSEEYSSIITANDGTGVYSHNGWLNELEKLAPFRAVVSRIASDVSSQEFYVRQRIDSKKWQRADEDTDEFCLFLENCWSSFGGGTFDQLVELCQAWDDTAGKWLLLKDIHRGKIRSLVPVPPNMFTIENHRAVGEEILSEIVFNVTVPGTQMNIKVLEEDAIWYRNPKFWNPSEPGGGLAQCLCNEADQYKNATKYTNSFFANGATPHIIVEVNDPNMMDNDLKRIKNEWRKSHEGVLNAFRALFINKGIKVTPIQPSQSDMQLDETKKSSIETFMMVYSIPPAIMGLNKNSEDIEASTRVYSRLVIYPRLKRFCKVFNQGIKKHFPGRQLWFVSPIREAAQDEREKTLGAWTNGLIDRDQACQDLGYDPPGGEIGKHRMVPANMVIVDSEGKVVMSTAGQGGAESGGSNNSPKNNPTPGSGLGKPKI
jgi:HK97 family phage portal protein